MLFVASASTVKCRLLLQVVSGNVKVNCQWASLVVVTGGLEWVTIRLEQLDGRVRAGHPMRLGAAMLVYPGDPSHHRARVPEWE